MVVPLASEIDVVDRICDEAAATIPRMTITLALLRQHDPLPRNFEDGDELWIIQALDGDGMPVGYGTVKQSPSFEHPLLEFVFIAKQRRRQGIARGILQFATKQWGTIDVAGPTSNEGAALLACVMQSSLSAGINKIY